MRLTLTSEQIAQYNRDGYLMINNLFDAEEMDLLLKISKADRELEQASHSRADAQGGRSKLTLSFVLGSDVYSAVARCERVVGPTEQLLGEESLHFHHKMMLKEPRVGGAWEWHQDYGYWYKFEGFLYPNLLSCMIAVDRATKENGCLQVLRGSHLLGRIEHGTAGEQTGADLERVNAAMKHLELIYCEMEPGTGLFFHSNLLHRSDQNRSPNSRWSLICCYTAASNPYCRDTTASRLTRIEKLPDAQFKPLAQRVWNEMLTASLLGSRAQNSPPSMRV
jgi:ectoine hydroxylase-related dioxygenase (phytanoyl-CoA dioxygenase family)